MDLETQAGGDISKYIRKHYDISIFMFTFEPKLGEPYTFGLALWAEEEDDLWRYSYARKDIKLAEAIAEISVGLQEPLRWLPGLFFCMFKSKEEYPAVRDNNHDAFAEPLIHSFLSMHQMSRSCCGSKNRACTHRSEY